MKEMNQRTALRAIGRGAVFGALGMLALALGRRAGAPMHQEVPCTGGGRCGACPALAGCGLPRGLSARSQGVQCSVFGVQKSGGT